MPKSNQEKRKFKRTKVSLPGVVHWRKSKDIFLEENILVVSLSRVGAGFNINNFREVGSIILLTLNMPEKFRGYDLDKKLYRIWGLVQYCIPISSEEFKYQIGVAFVGKNVPKSYLDDPFRSFNIRGVGDDGFWSLGEAKVPFLPRQNHRLEYSVTVRIAKIDSESKEITVDENAETDNISNSGAAVFSDLEVKPGDWVSFICQKPEFSSLAIIRNRQERVGNRTILNLEFMEFDYPIEDI